MDLLLSTGAQAVNNYSGIIDLSAYNGDLSGNVAKTNDEELTFSMYLYTNEACSDMAWGNGTTINLLSYSKGLYDTILGLNMADIINAQPPSASEEIKDITDGGKDNESNTDIEKFYSRIADNVPFSIEEEKDKEEQFGDMYVKSSAYLYAFTEEEKSTLTYDEYAEKSKEIFSGISAQSGSICVPIGAGDCSVTRSERASV